MDIYSKKSIEHWDNLAGEHQEQYGRPWKNIDINEIKGYLDGSIRQLPDDINWVYPKAVFKDVKDKQVLCLAGGGGQQSVIFSLLGAHVTVLDISKKQLSRDDEAARHYGYELKTVFGDMRDLSRFVSDGFDIVYQPVSICFVPDIRKVYDEVHRVLKHKGLYAVGHCNPTTEPVWFEGKSNGWDGKAYRIAEPYICGEIKQDDDGNENMTHGEGTGEFRHSFSSIFNELIAAGFEIRGVYEDPRSIVNQSTKVDPGNIHHFIMSYFKILAEKRRTR